MSEMMTEGGWAQYQRLVLAELERHNTLLQGIDGRIQNLVLEIELMKRDNLSRKDLEEQVRINTKRINDLETAEDVSDAVKKWRNWIVGGLFLFITALLIPVITLIMNALNGG